MGIRIDDVLGGNKTLKIPAGTDKKGKEQFLTVVYSPEKATNPLMALVRKALKMQAELDNLPADTLQEMVSAEDKMKREDAMFFQFELTAQFVGTLLIEWDLTDNAGKPWPTDIDSVSKLPQGVS